MLHIEALTGSNLIDGATLNTSRRGSYARGSSPTTGPITLRRWSCCAAPIAIGRFRKLTSRHWRTRVEPIDFPRLHEPWSNISFVGAWDPDLFATWSPCVV
jgi:hypothetical protein